MWATQVPTRHLKLVVYSVSTVSAEWPLRGSYRTRNYHLILNGSCCSVGVLSVIRPPLSTDDDHTFSWSCLGIKLSSLARKHLDPSVSQQDIFSGRYLELAVSSLIVILSMHRAFAHKRLAYYHMCCVLILRFRFLFIHQGKERPWPLPLCYCTRMHLFRWVTYRKPIAMVIYLKSDIALTTAPLFPYAYYTVIRSSRWYSSV